MIWIRRRKYGEESVDTRGSGNGMADSFMSGYGLFHATLALIVFLLASCSSSGREPAGGMVDIGGDICCFGSPPAGLNKWRIGLQDPDKAKAGLDAGTPLLVLNLTEMAVATSGNYRRFVEIDGQKYSHIIDPATADSAQSLSSVTIIAPTAMAADAMSTAVSVMGKEKGLEFIESIENTEALLLDANQKNGITKTTGAEQYIQGK